MLRDTHYQEHAIQETKNYARLAQQMQDADTAVYKPTS